MLVRVERPSAIPLESLHGRKEDAGRTLRLNVRAIVGAAELGEFSLRPQQGDVRAVFVPLARLQQDLDLAGRVNTLLVADRGDGASIGRDARDLDPAAVRARRCRVDDPAGRRRGDLAVESAAGLLDAARAKAVDDAAARAGTEDAAGADLSREQHEERRPPGPVLAGDRDRSAQPSACGPTLSAAAGGASGPPYDSRRPAPPIVLNDWAARDWR